MKLFLVGGAVRDKLLGLPVHDWDFTVEAESFDAMTSELKELGFRIFKSDPEFLTVRARFPAGEFRFLGVAPLVTTADFVLARKEGTYSDGRHPDKVEPGTILDDLGRRDFSINAMARDEVGKLIDPHDGANDVARGIIRAVGNPNVRLQEDALRALRALRFSVTKNMEIHWSLLEAMKMVSVVDGLAAVSVERVREELTTMFKHDTLKSMELLMQFSEPFRKAVFRDNLWLLPTLKRKD